MPAIEFDSVCKRYGNGAYAVQDFTARFEDGEFICILGPSGCGKSSTVRMLAGLERVSSGEIRADGRRLNETPPQARNAAMVFENYALYPHLDAFGNIAMPLRARRVPEAEIRERVLQAARTLRIEALLDRRPAQLSGGQRQRVSIGRAIVRSPDFFLMDEPLGHLEAYLRVELRIEIRAIQKRYGVTTLYVTHDQEEAAALADRAVVMSHGRIQQIGTFLDLLDRPANLTVAEFVGEPPMNILDATADGAGIRLGPAVLPLTGAGAAAVRGAASPATKLGIRPPDVEVSGPDGAELTGHVLVCEPQGHHVIMRAETPLGRVSAIIDRSLQPGEAVGLRFDRSRLHLFGADGRAILHGLGES
jgi:ABC-type sugar transport system ATPase subunit